MSFCDVAGNGNRRTSHLAGQPVEFFARKTLRQTINRNCQLHCSLPNQQLPKRLRHIRRLLTADNGQLTTVGWKLTATSHNSARSATTGSSLAALQAG